MDDRTLRTARRTGALGTGSAVDGAFINDIEGHLLVEAARAEGRTAARHFAHRMPWLTDTQRAEVERLYAEEHLSLTRHSWQHIARRSRELRGEYEETYRALRRRLLSTALCGIALAVVVVATGWAP
ncbi:hypothetical protein [Streptomyces sp. NPDC002564]|uniref:hypothetical protein n=1 Tax=Streptomyces sp. NPDC002564 TaxID=3364649 RepID=UPI0036AC033C